jgi:hypothetical protein
MSDRLSPEDWRRERALAALARAMRGEDDDRPERSAQPKVQPPSKGSLLSMAPPAEAAKTAMEDDAEWRAMAAERHRLARLRREAGRSEAGQTVPDAEVPIRSHHHEEPVPPFRTGAFVPEPPFSEPSVAEVQSADGLEPENPDSGDRDAHREPAAPPLAQAESVRRIGLREGISRSKPAIYRLTLLGAVLGVACAVLLWKQYGALMAFLPLLGVIIGLAAGLLLAIVRGMQKEAEPLSVSPAMPSSPGSVPPLPLGDDESSGLASAFRPQPVGDEPYTSGRAAYATAQPPSVEEIRASLRQFRAATQDLARRRDPR